MQQNFAPRQRIAAMAKTVDIRGMAMRTAALILAAAMLFALLPSRSPAADTENVRIAKAISNAYAEIVEQVGPAVVGIETEKVISNENFSGDESLDFERFFDMLPRGFGGPQLRRPSPDSGPREPRRSRGLGSGVIIDPKGYILTNNHVVADADSIKVELAFEKGKTHKAEIVGRDPNSDIAVIKLVDPPENLPIAKLGDSDAIKPGNIVIAIGAPLGFKQSVTTGIVSAKDRNLNEFYYERFIQTDAAINVGNSGGPLINLDGEVIGINTMISTGGGSGSIGIGFAIPMSQAKSVIKQLIEKGSVTRGFLGIVMNPDDPEVNKAFGTDGSGVLIVNVDPNGPAAKAGMQKNDLIVSFDGADVRNNEHLRYKVADTEPGTTVPVTVIRDGKRVNLNIKIEPQPEDMFSRARQGGKGGQSAPSSGGREEKSDALAMTVQNLSDTLRQRYNIPESVDAGVVVTKVESGSDAEDKRIVPGTVILEVDRKPVANVDEFRTVVDEAKGKDKVLVNVKNGDVARWIMVNLKK